LNAGFDDYVAKPYRPEEIFECMQRHLGVRYRREEAAPQPVREPASEVPADAIAALPAELRSELRDALVTLDGERIFRAIEKVARHDAAVGEMLARCAKAYQYTPILNAVEDGNEDSTASGD